ncbi:hypothetical protein L873DRAFT_1812728 [Choiromyces venosus 120613-1]|uniref:C2H2-type domain-containing protein n=1 Tax=Choiromyces venosus 120613-1 TaxID=1336337 RepID=A0A3N4JF67_9PEZI|nr:hypothetical protein L873DRAFT_1812728 [Choiromyces venosus 120613-1]
MAEAIELHSSPTDTAPVTALASAAPSSSLNTDRVDIASSSSSRAAPTVPTLAALTERFQTTAELNSYLLSLSKVELAAIIIVAAAKPSTATESKYAHCVYCHQIFDKECNVGCQIEHFGELGDIDTYDYDKQYTCCGRAFSYDDYDPDIGTPPEDEEPYCYHGKHWEKLIEEDDDEEGIWWQEWKESGNTCLDMGCGEMGTRTTRKKRRMS